MFIYLDVQLLLPEVVQTDHNSLALCLRVQPLHYLLCDFCWVRSKNTYSRRLSVQPAANSDCYRLRQLLIHFILDLKGFSKRCLTTYTAANFYTRAQLVLHVVYYIPIPLCLLFLSLCKKTKNELTKKQNKMYITRQVYDKATEKTQGFNYCTLKNSSVFWEILLFT